MLHAEQTLQDAVRRAMRAAAGLVAFALHLSRLGPDRPHHGRVGRALLEDAARRGRGQVFTLGNRDMVLLVHAADGGADLAASLVRLFEADGPGGASLVSRWRLPGEGDVLLRYAGACGAPQPPPRRPRQPAGLGVLDTVGRVVRESYSADVLHRRTAIRFGPGQPLRPAFHELALSAPVLDHRVSGLAEAREDPFVARAIAGATDAWLLEVAGREMRQGGLLAGTGLPLHLGLTVDGVLSDGFTPFVVACRRADVSVGIALSLLDACADADGFALARGRLRSAGVPLVLAGVSHHALALSVPAALEPDGVRLQWSPALPEAGASVSLALAALGPGRVVLTGADTEAAVAWGLAQGVRQFQGRHAEAMLAAWRMVACPHSGACSVGQCMERASATGPAGRVGCRNHPLLDAKADMARRAWAAP